MLSANKEILKTNLNNLIAENTSPMYKAAYNAYYNMTKANMQTIEVTDIDLQPIVEA